MEENAAPPRTDLDTTKGVTRRTVVHGAAWSLPVIAAAVGTPLAAASTAGADIAAALLPSPAGACGPSGDFSFSVTTQPGDVPAPSTAVIVTLPAGFSYGDGSTGAKSFISDGDGKVIVTGVTTSSIPGSYGVAAQIAPAGASTVLPIEVTGAVAGEHASNGTSRDLPGIALDSTALAWNLFLTPTGDLYWYDHSATPSSYHLIDSGVTSAKGQHYTGPSGASIIEVEMVAFVADGVAKTWQRALSGGAPATSTFSSVPSPATAVGWNTYLTPGGALYYGNTVFATGVTSAIAQHEENSAGVVFDWITYVDATGGHTARSSGGAPTIINNFGLLAGLNATAVGWNTYLTAAGDLYHWTGAGAITRIASGVASASAQHTSAGGTDRDLISYVNTAGTAFWRTGAGTPQSQSVGVGAVAKGWRTFLGADERLWLGTQVLATGVQSADGYHENSTDGSEFDWVAWTRKTQCFA